MTDFPFRKYSKEDLYLEYKKIKNKLKEDVKFPISISRIGYKCSNVFFSI